MNGLNQEKMKTEKGDGNIVDGRSDESCGGLDRGVCAKMVKTKGAFYSVRGVLS